jgi:hypothetical protein
VDKNPGAVSGSDKMGEGLYVHFWMNAKQVLLEALHLGPAGLFQLPGMEPGHESFGLRFSRAEQGADVHGPESGLGPLG